MTRSVPAVAAVAIAIVVAGCAASTAPGGSRPDSSVASRFDDLVTQAMPIVTSFRVHLPAR